MEAYCIQLGKEITAVTKKVAGMQKKNWSLEQMKLYKTQAELKQMFNESHFYGCTLVYRKAVINVSH